MTDDVRAPGPSEATDAFAERLAREQGALSQFWVLVYPGVVSALTVLPVLALGPLAFAIRQDFPLSAAEIGVVTSGFFLGSACFTAVGAALADRIRSALVVRAGVLASGAISAAIAIGDSRAVLMVGCCVAGAANGITAPAVNLVIMQFVPARRRGLAFGIKAAAVPAAASLGALGTWLVASHGFRWQWLYLATSGGAAVVVSVAVRFGAGRVRDPALRRARSESRRPPRSLQLIGLGGLLGATATGVLPPFLVDGLVAQGETPAAAAQILAIGGGLGIVSRLVVGLAADRYPRPDMHFRAAMLMLTMGGLGMAGIAVGGPTAALTAASLLAFGLGWSWPGLFHFAVLSTYRQHQAAATSLVQTGTFIGAVAGPTAFGLVVDNVGFSYAWGGAAIAATLASVLLQLGLRAMRRDALGA